MIVDERPFQAGDSIVCLRNDRRLGITNGTRASVVGVDDHRGTLTIETPKGRVLLPAEYLQAGHIAHGYATTIHKAQGATFDRGLLLGTDELHRDRGYVGMSRGRTSNHLYIVGGALTDETPGHALELPSADPIAVVRDALSESPDKRFAVDTCASHRDTRTDEPLPDVQPVSGLHGRSPINQIVASECDVDLEL